MAGKRNLTGWVKSVGAKVSAKAGAKLAAATSPPSEGWQPVGQPYPRLLDFDPLAAGLKDNSGIFAIWHLGVRPQWLKVAASRDLSSTLAAARNADSLVYFQPNGGVYVAWALIAPERAPGAALAVASVVQPVHQSLVLADEMPVAGAATDFSLPPGVQS